MDATEGLLVLHAPPNGEPVSVVHVLAHIFEGAVKAGELATFTVTCTLHVVGMVYVTTEYEPETRPVTVAVDPAGASVIGGAGEYVHVPPGKLADITVLLPTHTDVTGPLLSEGCGSILILTLPVIGRGQPAALVAPTV